jgi:hypothetical protein
VAQVGLDSERSSSEIEMMPGTRPEESLSPDELAARYLARFDWHRERSTEPRPPGGVLSMWEEWIDVDPERAWPLFEALVRLRPDDDEVLEQVWRRLAQLLARHGRAFAPRVRALVGANARLRRIVPEADLDPAAHRPRPLDIAGLVTAFITQSTHFEAAHEVTAAIAEEPERGIRLVLEIISRGPLHGFTSSDTYSELRDLLRLHGDDVIDRIEDAAADSILVQRCLWHVSGAQSHPPESYDVPADISERIERASAGTTDYNTDDPPGAAHSLPPEEEHVVESWFVREENFWAWERVRDIVENDPELAWRVIALLVENAPSDDVLGSVAAGPLEDFLGLYAEAYIERLETWARRDRRFRDCLKGVWQTDVPDELWARVQAAAESGG